MDADRNLQAAIYESLKSSNNLRPTPTRTSPARPMSQRTTYNTLAREGIKPSLTPTFAGSNFGQAKSRRASNDQQRSFIGSTENRILAGSKKAATFIDDGSASPLHLQRSQWIPLSEGWFQTTPMGTGSSSRAGLHSVVESSMGQLYICLYEPRTREATQACSHDPPEYDLEVSVKCMKAKDVGYELIFAYKSPTDFASVVCDITSQQWRLVRTCGSQETILAAIDASDMKLHTFYSLLLQIRGSAISLDINAAPVFTSLRIQDGSLTGLIGIKVKGSQIAIKGWKIRPVGKGSTAQSPARVRSLKDSLKEPPRVGPPPVPAGGGGPGASLSYTPTAPSTGVPAGVQSTLEQRHGRGITEIVLRDVVSHDLGVTFESIAALGTAKRLLNEAIVLPIIMPEFFTGIREPWKGVLLFGPPGTGKTLLAKAVANVNNATFYSCSAASLISKYRGESEKIVKCLFEAARLTSPSIIFLDEVDALVSSRSADEHEASRRLKTEFFSQMDGIASATGDNSIVMVLATTNCPWDLDEALRRRLEKRIYIPLPDLVARTELFEICLRNIPVAENVSPTSLARETQGYSGADIHLVCREAAMMPMRRLLAQHSPQEINDMKKRGELHIPLVEVEDFCDALLNTRPSVSSEHIAKYAEWDKEFGNK